MTTPPTKDTWREILSKAFEIFDDLEERGFGAPPFTLGDGTVLMLRSKHRLSKDIDLFTYDAQWIRLISPRLNERAASLAASYDEQANAVKIAMEIGDIDFIVAGQITDPSQVTKAKFLDREIEIDTTSEILAKKAFYRAAQFQPRDVYDMSAAIDIDPLSAATAIKAAASKAPILHRRLNDLKRIDETELLRGIVPYGTKLHHGSNMIQKVASFVARVIEDPNPADMMFPKPLSRPTPRDTGWER